MPNSLEKLKLANERLERAIDDTILAWPTMPRCWIDDTFMEPTLLLEKHKLDGEDSDNVNPDIVQKS